MNHYPAYPHTPAAASRPPGHISPPRQPPQGLPPPMSGYGAPSYPPPPSTYDPNPQPTLPPNPYSHASAGPSSQPQASYENGHGQGYAQIQSQSQGQNQGHTQGQGGGYGYGYGQDREYGPGPGPPSAYGGGAGSGSAPGQAPYGAGEREPPRHGRDVRDRDRDRDRDGPARGQNGGGRGRGRSPDGRQSRKMNERDRDGRTVEDRVNMERPCRTLFIRNVSYEADTSALRSSFAAYGEIKDYFDLIQKRGMIFITYFDLRAAEKARDAMHNTTIGKRSIDVHYSLPRADETNGPATREKNQGSILATLRRARVLQENDLGRLCERFGEVKTVKPTRSPDQKMVEFFDSRGAATFYDEMQDKPFMGGTLDLRIVWDELDPILPPPASERKAPPPPPPGPPRDRERDARDARDAHGGRNRGQFRSGEGPGYGEVKGGYRPPLSGERPPERYDDRRGSGSGSYPPASGPPPGRYGDAPPGPPPQDDRLEQARKVQELLASLGSAASAPPPPVPAPPPSHSTSMYAPAPTPSYPPPAPAYPPAPSSSYPIPAASAPPPSYPPQQSYAPSAPSTYPPYPAAQPSPPRPPPAGHPPGPPGGFGSNLPADVLALLQRPPPQGGGYTPTAPPGPGNYASPPPMSSTPYQQPPPQSYGAPPPPPQGQYGQPPPQQQQQQGTSDVNSLLAMLRSNR